MDPVRLVLGVALVAALALCCRLVKEVRAYRHRVKSQSAHARRLLHHLNHEVRNPLEVILGGCDMLLRTSGLQHQPSDAAAMREAASTLGRIARNATVVFGDLPRTEHSAIRIQRVMRECLEDRQGRAMARDVHLDFHVEPQAPDEIVADARVVRWVLENLLDHSLSIATGGSVEITLHAPEVDILEFSVGDSGPTFRASTLSRVFEPFALQDRLPGGAPPGVGLSLTAAKELTTRIGGSLSANARVHAGTVYRFGVPVRVISRRTNETGESTVVPFRDRYLRHRHQTSPQRILLIEDQASNAHIATATLTRAGHHVQLARSGDEALAALRSGGRFDVAIIDLGLPDISGQDVMRLSQLCPASPREGLPFIVLTGESSEAVRQECLAVGARAFLQKPMSSWRLLEAIAYVAEHSLRTAEASSPNALGVAVPNHPADSMLMAGFRDILDYRRDLETAARDRNWTAVKQHLRTIRGAAHLAHAVRVVTWCSRLIDLSEAALGEAWTAAALELDTRIDQAWHDSARTIRGSLR